VSVVYVLNEILVPKKHDLTINKVAIMHFSFAISLLMIQWVEYVETQETCDDKFTCLLHSILTPFLCLLL